MPQSVSGLWTPVLHSATRVSSSRGMSGKHCDTHHYFQKHSGVSHDLDKWSADGGSRPDLGGDVPGSLPLETLLVNQQPHELCHRNGWVGVVHLEAGLGRQLLQVLVGLLETRQCVLHGQNRRSQWK